MYWNETCACSFFSVSAFHKACLFRRYDSRIRRFRRLRFTARLKRFFGTLIITFAGNWSSAGITQYTIRKGYTINAFPSACRRAIFFSPHKCSGFEKEYFDFKFLKFQILCVGAYSIRPLNIFILFGRMQYAPTRNDMCKFLIPIKKHPKSTKNIRYFWDIVQKLPKSAIRNS